MAQTVPTSVKDILDPSVHFRSPSAISAELWVVLDGHPGYFVQATDGSVVVKALSEGGIYFSFSDAQNPARLPYYTQVYDA